MKDRVEKRKLHRFVKNFTSLNQALQVLEITLRLARLDKLKDYSFRPTAHTLASGPCPARNGLLGS